MVVIHMNSRNTPYRLILFNCLSIITYRICTNAPRMANISSPFSDKFFVKIHK